MKVTGFRTKDQAKAYQEQNGGKILWEEWSQKYGTFSPIGKAYRKAIKDAMIPLYKCMGETSEYAYIVVEDA